MSKAALFCLASRVSVYPDVSRLVIHALCSSMNFVVKAVCLNFDSRLVRLNSFQSNTHPLKNILTLVFTNVNLLIKKHASAKRVGV